jgi:hypothetical protein
MSYSGEISGEISGELFETNHVPLCHRNRSSK